MKKPRKSVRNKTTDYLLVCNYFTQEVVGRAADVTMTGMLLIATEELEKEELYKFKMIPPRKSMQGQAVTFIAQVRWSKFKKHTDWWEIGLEICEIEPPDAMLLHQIIELLVAEEEARQADAGRDRTIPKIEWIKNR